MPQSIQTCKPDTAEGKSQIMNVCKKHAGGEGEEDQCPRMPDGAGAGGSVAGLAHVLIGGEMLYCRFAVRPRDGRLVLAGASRARSAAAWFLAEMVEYMPRPRAVHAPQMDVGQTLRLFRGVVEQDRRNIIGRLALHFGPRTGLEYEWETYALIAYSFAENRCAGRHRDFKGLCRDARRTEMRPVISRCAGAVPEPGKRRHAMVPKSERAFRRCRGVPPGGRLRSCDAMLSFLCGAGG